MKVIVFTSDKYLGLLKDFSYLFNKHWGPDQEVNVLGFKKPDFELPDNFQFISAGAQSDFPARSFCQPFRPILENLDADVFTLMLEDVFLINKVDKDLLNKGVKLLESGKVSKIRTFLGADYQYLSSQKFTDDFNVFRQNINYRYTACSCIARKDYYLKYFDRETIWQLEVENIERSKNDGHNILVPKNNPIAPWINILVKGKFNAKQHNQMLDSKSGRHFGWNKFQKLEDEEYEIFLKYKNWEIK